MEMDRTELLRRAIEALRAAELADEMNHLFGEYYMWLNSQRERGSWTIYHNRYWQVQQSRKYAVGLRYQVLQAVQEEGERILG